MTLTVDDVRLPFSIERRAQAVRSFKTHVWEAQNGFEPQRLAVWPQPRRSWIIQSIPVRNAEIPGTDIETVVAMFEAARGMLYGFKYRPFHEHSVARAQGHLAYDATAGGFPLRKVYSNGVRSFARRIYLVDADTDPTVWVNGAVTAVTISASGVITGLSPSDTVEWEGGFLVPVRFDADDLDDEMSGDDGMYTLPTIKLRELLLG